MADQYGDFGYTTNGNTVTITNYTGPGSDVTIPDTIAGLPVATIGGSAFYGCTNLNSVMIGTNVTSIGDHAFYYCFGLTNVMIPNSVTNIGVYAFAGCSSLTAITVDVFNSVYSSEDGVLFNQSQTTLIQCPEGKLVATRSPTASPVSGTRRSHPALT